jgi:hypothetical protein
MIVIGDSDFLSDRFASNSVENISFGTEAVSWLSQEQSLAEIQLKQTANRQLVFEDETQVSLVKYGNMALAFAIPIIIGGTRIVRRKSLRKLSYGQNNDE